MNLNETADLREEVEELRRENLRLAGLLRITEMDRPTLNERALPLEGQVLAEADFLDGYSGPDRRLFDSLEEAGDRANVMTSLVAGEIGQHKIVLDVDHPVVVLPSSTPGHHHVIIDKQIEVFAFYDLLRALARAGVIEVGYKDASIDRGYTAIRLPWVKKGEDTPVRPYPGGGGVKDAVA